MGSQKPSISSKRDVLMGSAHKAWQWVGILDSHFGLFWAPGATSSTGKSSSISRQRIGGIRMAGTGEDVSGGGEDRPSETGLGEVS